MKTSTRISLSLFILGVALFLIQLWFQSWSPEMFSKLIVTVFALFVASYVVAFVIKEGKATDKLNKKSELD